MIIRFVPFCLAISLVGCGGGEQASSPAASTESEVVVEIVRSDSNGDAATKAGNNPPSVSQPLVPAPKPPEPSRGFEYPDDLSGKVVVKAVLPATPTLAPAERFGNSASTRALPSRFLNPEPTERTSYSLPPLPLAKSSLTSIPAPTERVPLDLGRGADALPSRPTLPIFAAITERARDVNLPPNMPILGRPLNERVSLDDPTSEFANAAIVSREVNVPLASADFVRVALPDPFELGEQIKTRVPATAEPGLSPTSVNPPRTK